MDIAKQRNPGGDTRGVIEDPIRRGASYLWHSLQAHRVMQDYTTSRFREHPSIAPMLNLNLFKSMTPKEKFDEVRKEILDLRLLLKEVKSTADKALSTANAAKGGGRREPKVEGKN